VLRKNSGKRTSRSKRRSLFGDQRLPRKHQSNFWHNFKNTSKRLVILRWPLLGAAIVYGIVHAHVWSLGLLKNESAKQTMELVPEKELATADRQKLSNLLFQLVAAKDKPSEHVIRESRRILFADRISLHFPSPSRLRVNYEEAKPLASVVNSQGQITHIISESLEIFPKNIAGQLDELIPVSKILTNNSDENMILLPSESQRLQLSHLKILLNELQQRKMTIKSISLIADRGFEVILQNEDIALVLSPKQIPAQLRRFENLRHTRKLANKRIELDLNDKVFVSERSSPLGF
jgi:hypothetical protein